MDGLLAMNKKQLITTWIAGILIGLLFFVNAESKRNEMQCLILSIEESIPVLIIAILLVYTLRNRLKASDFTLKSYEWTKSSRYALAEDGLLLEYFGDKAGFPAYRCLFKGWWEMTDACGVTYEEIRHAKPISEEQAKEITQRESKPLELRPTERNNWISC